MSGNLFKIHIIVVILDKFPIILIEVAFEIC